MAGLADILKASREKSSRAAEGDEDVDGGELDAQDDESKRDAMQALFDAMKSGDVDAGLTAFEVLVG